MDATVASRNSPHRKHTTPLSPFSTQGDFLHGTESVFGKKELRPFCGFIFHLMGVAVSKVSPKVPTLTILGALIGITLGQAYSEKYWDPEELIDLFTLLPNEYRLIGNKTGATRLGFAILLKFFQKEARFPSQKSEIPSAVVQYVAKQLNLDPILFDDYSWSNNTVSNHRSQIRKFFGFRERTERC
ncbi:DUF4158 domain-containing protein [Paludifilum halophilum]|uniref:DUF4158 domain-containing protein n=1 Tax=Paludifilum halophilum TaxID=1642702 RepID=UPI00146CCF75|nr:DUF4158 domain-containing protein [Paludifilum halophilum]